MTSSRKIDFDARVIKVGLSPFGINLDPAQAEQVRLYADLLLKWNRSLSLTTVTNDVEIVRRHFGESIFGATVLAIVQCRLVDIGTGAGFPGLALKIFCPGIHLTLIESNKKKCAFLAEVVRCLQLTDVEIRSERYEEIRPETIHANIITARAVGDFKQLMRWSEKALVRRGHIMLWVGSEDSTRIMAAPNWIWQPAVHIPDSQRRFILVGRPIESPHSAE
jgi:16S rRNA (guanine527-N7)-methyltransferase